MKKDYSTEFKLFIVQEALETKNIKRFLKRQEIPKSTFYTWLKIYKDKRRQNSSNRHRFAYLR